MGIGIINSIINLNSNHCIEAEIGGRCGFSPREMRCLLASEEKDGLTSKELSRRIGLSPSRGSRLINSFIKRGLFFIKADLDDRRCHRILLSVSGREQVLEIKNRIGECEKRLLSKLSTEEIDSIRKAMAILSEKL